MPCLGEFPRHKGLYAAFGHSHHGLMMAPATGEFIADMMTGRATNLDLSMLSPERFPQA
jgi:D-amino-acid dehydrogenase